LIADETKTDLASIENLGLAQNIFVAKEVPIATFAINCTAA
jgi:hypothetical protein